MNKIFKNKAIFLDRDWTINFDSNYVYKKEDLIILEWVKEWLKKLKNSWFLLIIITNQSWIWRGYYSMEDFNKFNEELETEIWIKFDEILVCPHKSEENCICRKPKINNILISQRKFWLNLEKCYFIWDKQSDIECWKNAWCKTVYVWKEKITIEPDFVVNSILELTNIIC